MSSSKAAPDTAPEQKDPTPSISVPPITDELPGSPMARRMESIKALERVGTVISGPILDSMKTGNVRFASLTLVTDDNTAKTFYFPFPYGKTMPEDEKALIETQVGIARFIACNEFSRVHQQMSKQQIDFIESASA